MQVVDQRGHGAHRIDADMLPETLVFGHHHRAQQDRRHRVEVDPFQHALAVIEAQALQHHVVAIEQHRLRTAVDRAHLGVARHLRGQHQGRDANAHACESDRDRARGEQQPLPGKEMRASSCYLPAAITSIFATGSSPNTSGAYMASTRVAGISKWPALLRRTVYSIVNFPFGT